MGQNALRALIIAGGVAQIELLKQLRERDIYTILADGNQNAVAVPYADKFYCIQIFDIDAVKNLAQTEQVDFIITVCADQVLLVVAQVSEILGLPFYIDNKTAQNVSDKIKMKRIFRQNGIPTSKYVETDVLDEMVISELRYPLVVKPVDAYSSKGVRKALNTDELSRYFDEAMAISRSGKVIVEEYCPGEEISVDAFIINGKAHILCISNSEKILDDGRFVIFRGKYPAAVNEDIANEIGTIAQKITDAFGLVNAPLLIQIINNHGKLSVLEFCARTGGNIKWLLIKHSSGVDVISAAIDLSLGIIPEINPHRSLHKYVVNDYIYCKPGVYDHAEGFAELQEKGLLNEYFVLRPKGTLMRGVSSSSDRIAGFNITADSLEEFDRKHRTVVNSVRIIDSEGNDIMRHDLLPVLR